MWVTKFKEMQKIRILARGKSGHINRLEHCIEWEAIFEFIIYCFKDKHLFDVL